MTHQDGSKFLEEYSEACGLNSEIHRLFRPKGCPNCNNTGFSGRIGIHEFFMASAEVKQAIASRQSVSVIREKAMTGGMRTLKMDGIRRVINGQTTLGELLKVCID